jgi:hypothetical protein
VNYVDWINTHEFLFRVPAVVALPGTYAKGQFSRCFISIEGKVCFNTNAGFFGHLQKSINVSKPEVMIMW